MGYFIPYFLIQWVFYSLLKNIKLQKMQSLAQSPNICLIYFKEKLLVLNTCYIFRKTSKINTIGAY